MSGPSTRREVEASNPPVVSIVLATLNERENLPVLVDRLLTARLPPFEVIVVDDGSTDGTRAFLAKLACEDPRFHLIFHEGKQTTVRAQGQGIEAGVGDFVVIMDADLQHPPELIPALCQQLDRGSTLVVASRYAPGGTAGPRTPGRVALSRGAEWIAKAMLPEARALRDPMSGFFAFRRGLFRPLNPLYRGYKLLLFVLAMNGERTIVEVGYRFEPRAAGASKLTEGREFYRLFLVEVLLAKRLHRELRHAYARPGTPPGRIPK